MSKKDNQLWKYPLPDDWAPDGTWCMQITVPADQQYVDIVCGALGALTQSKPFQPDATGAGPQAVAEAFEAALYIVPFILSQTCIVTPIPPIPDQAAADDAAAAIFTVFFQHIIGELNTCATTFGACGGCVDTLVTELTPYGASEAVRGVLNDLCSNLNQNPSTRAEYETDCVYGNEYDAMRQHIHDNPYDWLNSITDFMFNWLNQTADSILQDLNIVGGLIGGGGMQKYVNDNGGIPSGGGAGFGTGCTFHHEFWATGDDGGWVNVGAAYFNGSYWTTGDGTGSRLCDIIRDFDSRSITHMEVHVSSTDVGNSGNRNFFVGPISTTIPQDAGDQIITWDGTQTANQIGIGFDTNSPPGVSRNDITRVIIEGIGQDPFI